MKNKKISLLKKILFLSDHPLAPSGVGVQARFLIEGLIKTGKYSFNDLPPEAKQACMKFEKQKLLTREEYVRDYFGE